MTLLTGVETDMLEVCLPKIFPTMSRMDTLQVQEWYVQEQDIIQPGNMLVEIEAPVGLIDIPTPPEMITPHRVVYIAIPQGGQIRLGDPLIILKAVDESTT